MRWLPAESVFENDFSTKSDVWAFGVLMWEVFSHGELPYSSQSHEDVLEGANINDYALEAVRVELHIKTFHTSIFILLLSVSLLMHVRTVSVYEREGCVSVLGLQAGTLKLSAPETCPSKVYKLMSRCWAPSLKERPSFSEIIQALGDIPLDSNV